MMEAAECEGHRQESTYCTLAMATFSHDGILGTAWLGYTPSLLGVYSTDKNEFIWNET